MSEEIKTTLLSLTEEHQEQVLEFIIELLEEENHMKHL